MVFLLDAQIDAAFAIRHSPFVVHTIRLPPSKTDFQATFACGSPWMRRDGGLMLLSCGRTHGPVEGVRIVLDISAGSGRSAEQPIDIIRRVTPLDLVQQGQAFR